MGHSPPSQSAFTTVTLVQGAPGLVQQTNHGRLPNAAVRFETTGALPTGLTVDQTVYVVYDQNFNDNQFTVSNTPGGAPIAFTGSPSGTQSISGPVNGFRVLRIQKEVTEAYVIAANAAAAKAAARLLGNHQWIRRKVYQFPQTEDQFEYDVVSSDDGT